MERHIDREKERKIFCLLVNSPSGHDSRSRSDMKLGVRSFFWVSYLGAESQGLGHALLLCEGGAAGIQTEWAPGAYKVKIQPLGSKIFLNENIVWKSVV